MIIDRPWLLFAAHRNRRGGFLNFHLKLSWLDISIFRNRNIDTPRITFVRKSTFTMRCIVHPTGGADGKYGNTARFVCEECGADYPYGAHPMPCPNCACWRESGIVVRLFSRKMIDLVRSEHGYAVVLHQHMPWGFSDIPINGEDNKPVRFHWRRSAEKIAQDDGCGESGKVIAYPLNGDMARIIEYPWSQS